jgi:excisionase family DNA binding protein
MPKPKPQKYATIEGEPVLLFDNSSSGSSPFELLTVGETASFLRVSITGIRRLQKARHLPFFKVGGSLRFAKSDLLAYLQKRRIEPVD